MRNPSDEIDYVTYAPNGSRCDVCETPIGKFEPVHRVTIERASAAPAVRYRHTECPA